MLEQVALILTPLVLMIVGLGILWAQAWQASQGLTSRWGPSASFVSAAGCVLVSVGLFAAVGLMTHVFFILAWTVTAVVLVSLLYRYRDVERRSLLWTLMLAAEREIPLETAARAFAEERHDFIGRRTLDLAEYLEAGLPLALALKRARLLSPPAVMLAAELGQQTGNLGGALRQALGQSDDSEGILRSVAERAFYLVFLVFFAFTVLSFLMLKIVPVFQKIFEDFDCGLPVATILLVSVARFFCMYWPLVLLGAAMVLFVVVRSLSYYTGSSPRYLPGLTSMWHRTDRSLVMRWLALAVRQNRPLPDMMRLIAGYLTRRGLRRKMERAIKRLDQGSEWTECLFRAGLILRSEAAVFQSAQRAGNLAWALEEMAESSVRRSVYRFRAVTNLAFPAVFLALGGSVGFIVFGILTPLFHLIQALI
jgi:type II secretory pathway component PulF